jgi:hypothetical protein
VGEEAASLPAMTENSLRALRCRGNRAKSPNFYQGLWSGKETPARAPMGFASGSEVNGLFNLRTGQARTYLDLSHAVCDAAGKPRLVEFIDMPEELRGQYQSFTQAPMDRLRAAGYPGQL